MDECCHILRIFLFVIAVYGASIIMVLVWILGELIKMNKKGQEVE